MPVGNIRRIADLVGDDVQGKTDPLARSDGWLGDCGIAAPRASRQLGEEFGRIGFADFACRPCSS
jgi:hypothetical protein